MLETLLPIFGVTVRLRFRRAENAPFFHQPLVRPFLKELLRDKAVMDETPQLWVDAVNSGVTAFRRHDEYRFTIYCLEPALPLIQRLIDALRRLPGSYPGRRKKTGLLADNLEYLGLLDAFTGQPVKRPEQLFAYDEAALEREWRFWREQPEIHLRLTAPARLKRQKRQAGDIPYINDRDQLHAGETERRVWRALSNLEPRLGALPLGTHISYEKVTDRLFWTDNAKTLDDGRLSPFGGVLGDIRLSQPASEDPAHLPLLVLGQYLGLGERRAYGLGRYFLQTPDGRITAFRNPLHPDRRQRSARISNLERAVYNMARKHPDLRRHIDHSLEDIDPAIEDQLEDKLALNQINLHHLGRLLASSEYRAPELQGVILRRPGRHPRPLAIPPLHDRIVQRAVVEVLGQDIDQLSTDRSYGYRRGHSRMQARDRILALNRQGYKWFFEADITEFFDSVEYDEIRNRLESFFPRDSLLPLLMDWVGAPVRFDGRLIRRRTGLPQGSPISPMLANLLLEDFDADMESRGMKLVRFADDFVVLCKTRHQALTAARQAQESLAELGLEFNPEKTGIGQMSDGFDFLGYSFLDGMAVERHRPHHAAGKLHLDQIPTASWLACLLQQEPELLSKLNNRLDKKSGLPRRRERRGKIALPASDLGSTLFITPPAKYLHQREGALEVRDPKTRKVLARENWNDLSAVLIQGRHSISQRGLTAAMENGVALHFCTETGRYQGMASHHRPGSEGAGLWLQQSRAFAPESTERLPLCRALVSARIHNQLQVLRQRQRHEPGDCPGIGLLEPLLAKCASAEEAALRGYEGSAGSAYYQSLKRWVPDSYGFNGRNKRPPRDPFNALLSLGYTVLYSHAATLAQVAGLYPWQGFYHRSRDRHLALASDLMEPYRHIVERTALTLLRARQLKEDDFHTARGGACLLTRNGRRIYLRQLSNHLLEPVLAKNAEQPLSPQAHLLRSARQLVRHLRDPRQPLPNFFRIK